MTRLRWGIIGTGNIAKQFADGVRHSDRGDLVAVASRTEPAARGFASTFDLSRTHVGYDTILRDPDVDAIYLSLPNAMHREWTIRALDAGKHVLCEKPLAATAAEAEQMFAAADRNGRVLIEAFMYRAHPQTQAILDTVRGGAIGTVKSVRTSFCFRVRQPVGNIRFDAALQGGALMDVGCYCVSFSRLIADGDPVDVRALATLHAGGVDEQTTAILRYANGITAEFTCGMNLQADNTAHVCGDEGYLTVAWPWKPPAGGTQIVVRGSIPPRQDHQGATTPPPAAPEPRVVDVPNEKPLYAIEADAFAACVLDGAPAFVSRDESMGNARTIEAIARQTRAQYDPKPTAVRSDPSLEASDAHYLARSSYTRLPACTIEANRFEPTTRRS